jgi:NitT/TauT family transport system substrate-binding protein
MFAGRIGKRSPRTTRLLAGGVAAALSLLIAGCGDDGSGSASAGGEEVTTITLAPSSGMSASWAAFAVAEKQGYFEEEGLDVQLQFPGGSGDVLQSMAVGRTDLGIPTPEAILAGVEQGQDLVMTYAWTRGPVQSLAVQEESPIKGYEDLKGKTVGVSSLSSGAKILAEAIMELKGLNPAEDVTFLAVGTGVAAWDALQRSRVDALMLWDTEYAAMENVGADLRTIRPAEVDDLFSTTLVATKEWLDENEEAMAGFGRAWAKATVWANANPQGAVRAVWEQHPETLTGDPEELLPQHVKVFEVRNEIVTLGDPASSKEWGRYEPEAVEHWVDFALEYGVISKPIDPESIYTNEFVDEYNDFDAEGIREAAKSAATG